MTLPLERYRSLLNAIKFMQSLCDPKATPRVPKWIRREARYALKHFPHEYEIEQIAKALPKLFKKGR